MRRNNVLIRQKTYNSVLLLLDSIFSGKKYPEVVISELFRKEDLLPDEKTVIVGLVYGILRHLGRLDYVIEHASRARITNLGPDILNSIRICAYQAVFTDSRAAGIVNNIVAMSSHNTKLSGFAKRTIEALIRNKDTVIFPDPPIEYIPAYHSHPRWIVEKWNRR